MLCGLVGRVATVFFLFFVECSFYALCGQSPINGLFFFTRQPSFFIGLLGKREKKEKENLLTSFGWQLRDLAF
jgi:hypothetical protein